MVARFGWCPQSNNFVHGPAVRADKFGDRRIGHAHALNLAEHIRKLAPPARPSMAKRGELADAGGEKFRICSASFSSPPAKGDPQWMKRESVARSEQVGFLLERPPSGHPATSRRVRRLNHRAASRKAAAGL
jgi:hypothetical protein